MFYFFYSSTVSHSLSQKQNSHLSLILLKLSTSIHPSSLPIILLIHHPYWFIILTTAATKAHAPLPTWFIILFTHLRSPAPFIHHPHRWPDSSSLTWFIILLTHLWSPTPFIHHPHWSFLFNQPSSTHAGHTLSLSLCVFMYVVVDFALRLLKRS